MSEYLNWLIAEYEAALARTASLPAWARPVVTRPLRFPRHRKPGAVDCVGPTTRTPRAPRRRKEP